VDPQVQFCPNSACLARGQVGRGNITIHSQREQRYRCALCGRTFSARTGTPFYRQQYAPDLITLVVTRVAHGCPQAAIVVAFGLHPRTVARWARPAGTHCAAVHAHLVEQPRALGQVQADELRVKTQAGIVWIAMAVQVATRLWLGGVVSAHRDRPTDPIRDYLIAYAGTAQEAAVKLILEKVRVSELFDGFDLDAGLATTGVQSGETNMALGNATTSIGRTLYEHLREHSGLLRAAAFTSSRSIT
jgi:transposase-like protein